MVQELWMVIWALIGAAGAVMGLPAAVALMLFGETRVRKGASTAAALGLFMLIVSIIGMVGTLVIGRHI